MRKILYKSFLVLTLLLAGTTLGVAATKDVTILSSSSSEFYCTVHNSLAGLERQTEADSTITFFNSVHVGIPYGATVNLVLVQGASLTALDIDDDELAKLSPKSYPLAVLSAPITVRGRQLVAVRVFPVVENSVYQEVTLKLGFSGGLTDGGVPANDPQFDRILAATLANFDQFKTWPVPDRGLQKVAQPVQGPFGMTSSWFKIAVNQTGLYKITGAQLEQVGLILDNLPSDSIHLFNGGGLPLEVSNDKPRPAFTEVSLLIEDGNDGIFNRSDYIIFFGEAVDRWLHRSDTMPRFINNPYTDRNIYWLCTSGFPNAGRRMSQIDAAPYGSVDTVITTFRRRVHAEEDHLLRCPDDGVITDYYRWYWANESELIFFVSTPGAIDEETASVQLVGRTYDNGDSNDSLGYMDLYVNGDWAVKTYCDRSNCSYYTASLVDGLNEIRVALWRDVNAPPYFDYLDLQYSSRLVPSNNTLDIALDSLAGSAQIEVIDDFRFPAVVLDVADPLHPAILTGYDSADGLITFQAELEDNGPNRFYVGTIQQALAPFFIEPASPPDLRAATEQIDLFIVAPREFAKAMDEYVDYRQTDGISMAVVTIEDIMDNFAYGLYDPTAIRDFLKYAYQNYPSPAPSAVLLVGDGTYDYLDHLGKGISNHVPPYIHPYDESASDDNYVYFGEYGILDSDTSFDTSYVPQDRGYDMMVARWPARNIREINIIISKTKVYESPANFGLWRTNILLVADDEFGTLDNETFHVTQTEELEKNHIPPLFHREKIYLWEYPFVNLSKPAVNDAIVNSINKGTLLFNFVGHGNPEVLAHEHVFTRSGDLPRLNNFNRLPLVFTASCAIGFFDDPKRESMGEDLLVHATGGAIGVVSSTRLVYASENAQFNRKVFDVLLYSDSLSIGEAVYTAKLLRQYNFQPNPRPVENDRAYLFFGDPYVKLGIPRLDIEFTNLPTSLTALGRTSVSGQVIDKNKGSYSHEGYLLINVYDSERQKTYRVMDANGNVIQKIDYTVTGPTIYRGSATIRSDGSFEFEFIPPLDIGYGGKGAKIVVYAIFDTTDAAGLIDSLTVSDSVVALADSTGPTVIYAFPQRKNFVSGDLVSRNDVLEITASDPSGINLAGGLGHGITLVSDDRSENTINLTDRFEYNQDDFTTGKVVYSLENMSAGRHTFKIKVWDNANNSTSVEFAAEVMADEKLAIVNLLNYPNPMKDSTRFSLELTQPVRSFTLEIFTLSGRKIKSFGPQRPDPGYYDDIVWYGRDTNGDRVATGVYIYKATAFPLNGGDEIESFGKVVVIN
jgi:hypothetical protein